jgi:hypothetical protein
MTLFRRWLTETGETYVVSLVRLLLGILLLVNAARELTELNAGPFFGDVFHLPMLPEALLPSKAMFTALVFSQAILAAVVISGRFAREALLGSAAIGIYLLLCDRLAYHNNRYALFLFSFLVAFAPCDDAFVLGRRSPPGRSTGPLWAQRLAQAQLAIVYLASGGSKLVDPDWRGGLVIGDRLLKSTQSAIEKGVPEALMRGLSDPAVASVLSKIAIASELSLAVALFLPRTRVFALWWGTMFHFTIEVTSQVELFGWLTLTIYALFAVPKTRERVLVYDPHRALGRAVARVVHWLDWLARFERRADAAPLSGRAFAVVDRDGTTGTGLYAVALIARATPVLFPLSIPLLAVGHVSARPEGGRRSLGGESLAARRSGSEDLPE